MNLEALFWGLNERFRSYESEFPPSDDEGAQKFLDGWNKTYYLMRQVTDRISFKSPNCRTVNYFNEWLGDYPMPSHASELYN